VLPNEYVLLESSSGSTVVIDEPAKTVIPASARLDFAAALPATANAHNAITVNRVELRIVIASSYAVYASSAFEAWSMVSAGGNAKLNVLPPRTVLK